MTTANTHSYTHTYNFNFDEVIDRVNSDCAKWHYFGKDVLPMWVADMDFKSPEPVIRALRERVEHGVFGYAFPQADISQVIVNWLARRYNWHVQPEDIVLLPGLVCGLNVIGRAVGRVGDNAVVITPVYFPFMTAPVNQGMNVTKVPMKEEQRGEFMHFEIDFDAFEKAITPRTSLFIHCHPQNPIGREFTEDENRKLAEICLKKNVVFCSDEIWADLTLTGTRHVPVAMLSPEIAQNTITLMAPSKTFNMPGLGFSFAIIQNPKLRQQILNAKDGIVPFINAMGLTAAKAALTEGDAWLAALQSYLTENRNVALDYIAENMPDIKSTKPDSTYLLWLNTKATGIAGHAHKFFMDEAKVALSDGVPFGPGGEGYLRLNFGCPRAQMLTALDRMQSALKNHK
jgi:cystathionine beta-lyase